MRIADRAPLIVTPNADNLAYLTTKRSRMEHLLELPRTAREVS